MKISVIGGTGPQGLGIAERLAIAGLDVIVGSRKEEKALDVVAKAKEDLADYDLSLVGMANEDAAKEGDVLIITVPLAAQKPTVEGIKEFCTDKIVMDATVPLETAIGGKPFRFIDLMEGSAAERTASILEGTGAKVICDDKEAKETAAEIIDQIPGVKTIDCGILEKARIIEKITPLLIGLNIKYKSHYGGLRITGIPALDK